jgi:hypothetical protein
VCYVALNQSRVRICVSKDCKQVTKMDGLNELLVGKSFGLLADGGSEVLRVIDSPLYRTGKWVD